MATYYDLTQTGAQVQTILNNSLDADYVAYDNSTSGLAATDVQAAIDEVDSNLDNISLTAAATSYDNTNSGLAATTVQAAIDEIDTTLDAISYSKFTLLWTNSDPTSNFSAQTVTIDLTNYDAVFIIMKTAASASIHFSGFALKDFGQSNIGGILTSGGNRVRGATATDSGVDFTTGYNGGTANTQYAIPCYIYGVKF